MSETFLSDNKGHRVPPHPDSAHPVAASGLTETLTTAGTNYTLTVEQGESYKVISTLASSVMTTEIVFMGITGAQTVTANREWMFPLGQSGIVHIPIGQTTLNMTASVSGVIVYLVKLEKAG